MSVCSGPALSVIIPVHNAERYLARCLDSVLGQSFRDLEVLCVDDGSTDASSDILRACAQRDSRLCVITQENRGVSAARNAGLDAARGAWISFVDCDDELLPDAYARLLEDCGDEDFMRFGAEEVRELDGTPVPVRSGYFEVGPACVKQLSDEEVRRLSMTVWDKLYRRDAIEACALRFPEGLRFEDNAFVLNFAALHRRCRFVPQKCYRYFRHEDSFTDTIRRGKDKIAFDYIRILDPVHEFWEKHALLPGHQALFEQLCRDRLQEAVEICRAWEIPGIVYELAASLHRWNVMPKDRMLRAVREGELSLRLGRFTGTDVTMLRPLKGLQKLLFIGNRRGRRVLCLFGVKLADWKK